MKVWLDDKFDIDGDRRTPSGWIGVKTAHEVIALLKRGAVEALSLDHDLGDEESVGSGYDVLEWIEKEVATNGFNPPRIIKIHSANSSVYPKMNLAIESIEKLAAKNKQGE
jgi:hypothetical protein